MRLRAVVGPIAVGLSVWCALGYVTVASADSSTLRLGLLPPWWVLLGATAAAFLIPAWRRDARLALPALLSTLPWWPVPLPAVALIWTGPLAWAPILLALGAAAGAPVLRALGRAPGVSDVRRAPWLAGALTLVVALLAAWAAAPRVPGGDEPHYLAISQSLLRDGDLRIENNHKDPDFVAAFGVLKPDSIARGRDGQLYSIHAPGVAVAVLPAYAAFGYRGAQATMLLLAAITGALIWRVGWRVSRDTTAAWFAWTAVVGSSTFLFQSFTVFPDGPGAFVVAASVLLLVTLSDETASVGPRALAGTSALLAALPWLHTRLVVLAAGLGLLIVWQLLADRLRPAAARRRRVATFLALPVVSALGWFAFFQVIYGTPNPTAPYGPHPEGALRNVPGALVALLFDGQFGLLAYSPVLIVAALGLRRAASPTLQRTALGLAAVAMLYLVAVTTVWMWWAGIPAPPARFTAAILPVLGLLLAVAWTRAGGKTRVALLTLLGTSLAITLVVFSVDRAGLGWNDRDAQARWLEWLGPVVNLPRGWPSFFWKLDPARLETELPFVLHAVVWLAAFVATSVVVFAAATRRAWSIAASRAAAAWWLALALMGAVQAGWWLNRSSGLDPARSQLATIGAERHGSKVMQIGPVGWHAAAEPERTVLIRSDEPGLRDQTPPLLSLAAVPPGTYELRLTMARPRPAQVAIFIGRGRQPLRQQDVLALEEQSLVLALPAGAIGLTITGDPAMRSAGARLSLAPVHVEPAGRLALTGVRYGAFNVFFLDDGAFVETEGFWVRGGKSAEIALAAAAGSTVKMLLRNGPVENAVDLSTSAVRHTVILHAGEERVVDVAVPDAGDALRLRITSPAGFRPSESPAGDRRFLGVWAQIIG